MGAGAASQLSGIRSRRSGCRRGAVLWGILATLNLQVHIDPIGARRTPLQQPQAYSPRRARARKGRSAKPRSPRCPGSRRPLDGALRPRALLPSSAFSASRGVAGGDAHPIHGNGGGRHGAVRTQCAQRVGSAARMSSSRRAVRRTGSGISQMPIFVTMPKFDCVNMPSR